MGKSTKANAEVAQKKVGTAPNMPDAIPIQSKDQRYFWIRRSRSSALACFARTSYDMSRMVNQPQSNGGKTATNGGTHQTGKVNMTKAKQIKADHRV